MADNKAGSDAAARFNPLDYPQCLDLPARVSALPWHEHIPFAKILVQLLRPKVFVKLGIHTGESYMAVCETAAALGVACYGVEANRVRHAAVADEQTVKALHAYHDSQFGNFSRLMSNSGSDAATHFTQGSVDLLQIDDLHSYEAVCKDWETWRPKLSRAGVVLFHHTNVREGDFGVWKLWKELRPTYRHFEFLHGEGLGMLVAGSSIPETFNSFLTWAEKNPEPVRKYFFALGNRLTLRTQTEDDRTSIAALEVQARASAARDEAAQRSAAELALQHAAEVARLDAKIEELERSLRAREEEATKLAPLCVSRATEIEKLKQALAAQEPTLQSLGERLEKVSAEAARLRETQARVLNGLSYKWGRTLSAPVRLFTGEKAL
jgi:hypothetical protein